MARGSKEMHFYSLQRLSTKWNISTWYSVHLPPVIVKLHPGPKHKGDLVSPTTHSSLLWKGILAALCPFLLSLAPSYPVFVSMVLREESSLYVKFPVFDSIFLTIFPSIKTKPGCSLKGVWSPERDWGVGHHWQWGRLDLLTYHTSSSDCVSAESKK